MGSETDLETHYSSYGVIKNEVLEKQIESFLKNGEMYDVVKVYSADDDMSLRHEWGDFYLVLLTVSPEKFNEVPDDCIGYVFHDGLNGAVWCSFSGLYGENVHDSKGLVKNLSISSIVKLTISHVWARLLAREAC